MQPPAEAPAPTLDDGRTARQQAVTGLLKIGMAIRHHAWAGGEASGLTPTQGQILSLLHHREDRETRPADVAADLAITPATASVALRTLVEKGLVAKTRAESDARALVLTLTDSGRELARHSLGWTDFLLDAIDALDDDELGVFQRSLVKMIRAMQERGHIPVSRMCVTCRFFRPHAHPGTPQPHHCAYVDAPFGDRELRLDCADFAPAPPADADRAWAVFSAPLVTSPTDPSP
jgi:DNA-binding MarR family transcriptional regulator